MSAIRMPVPDPRILARLGDARRHRVRVVAVKEQIAFDVALCRCAIFRNIAIGVARGAQQAVPIVAIAVGGGQQGNPRPRLQQPCSGFGALHVAGDPIEIVGGS